MKVTWSQFAQAMANLEPEVPTETVRARFDALASGDGDNATLSLVDIQRASAKLAPASALQALRLVESEQANMFERLGDGRARSILSFAAGQPQRLRLLDRGTLVAAAQTLIAQCPTDGFRLASILADAVVSAARDPRLSARDKERIIEDTTAALLALRPADVAYAFQYEKRLATYLSPEGLARATAFRD